jgi:hypothetical protein
MKLSVKPNKNTFLIFAILNLCGYHDNNDYQMYPIRAKILKDYEFALQNPKLKQLTEIFKKGKIYRSYLYDFALNSTENFAKIDYNHYRFNETFLEANEEEFANLMNFVELSRDLIKELKLSEFFDKEISEKLVKLCQTKQLQFNKVNLTKIFYEYWGITLDKDIVLIPNLLEAIYRANGVEDSNNFYSFRGPDSWDIDKFDLGFSSQNIICSGVHEVSHFYFDKIFEKVEISSLNTQILINIYDRLSDKFVSEKSAFDSYLSWRAYFEETFVRVSETLFLSPKFLKTVDTNENILAWQNSKIQDVLAQKFVFFIPLMQIIERTKANKEPIEKAWSDFINYLLTTY